MGKGDRSKRLILIPAGKTDWTNSDRVQGNTDLPLSSQGNEEIDQLTDKLSSLGIGVIYSGKLDPPAETAKRIAKTLRLKHRFHTGLEEVDLGLWQGLHISELKEKHPKVYKRWVNQPDQVVPPKGESFSQARRRISVALENIVHQSRASCIGIVLGTSSMALIRSKKEQIDQKRIWDLMKEDLTWHEYLV